MDTHQKYKSQKAMLQDITCNTPNQCCFVLNLHKVYFLRKNGKSTRKIGPVRPNRTTVIILLDQRNNTTIEMYRQTKVCFRKITLI